MMTPGDWKQDPDNTFMWLVVATLLGVGGLIGAFLYWLISHLAFSLGWK